MANKPDIVVIFKEVVMDAAIPSKAWKNTNDYEGELKNVES